MVNKHRKFINQQIEDYDAKILYIHFSVHCSYIMVIMIFYSKVIYNYIYIGVWVMIYHTSCTCLLCLSYNLTNYCTVYESLLGVNI